jgi:hypothetical protein
MRSTINWLALAARNPRLRARWFEQLLRFSQMQALLIENSFTSSSGSAGAAAIIAKIQLYAPV